MTLLTVLFAAILCTVLWYRKAPRDEMKVGVLCWMYWGASLVAGGRGGGIPELGRRTSPRPRRTCSMTCTWACPP